MTELESLDKRLRVFAAVRDWGQVHSPNKPGNARKYPPDKVRGNSTKYIKL